MALLPAPAHRLWHRLSRPTQAALLVTSGVFFFALMTGLARHASSELHPFQVTFFRAIFGALFLAPWLIRAGLSRARTKRLPLHLLRGAIGATAMILWFTAVSLLPIAEATALSFTAPLYATLLAPFMLGERVGIRRLGATLVGFAGALVILRPGLSAFDPNALIVVVGAALVGIEIMLIKKLARTDSPDAIVLYLVLVMIPVSFVMALTQWQWPSWSMLGVTLAIGFCATSAHQLMTRGFARGDASFVVMFHYTMLPMTAVIGWFAFGQATDLLTWVGAAIIALAAIYIARRESRAATVARKPQAAGE
ncbi:MAG: DMT family transporter [Alphaproteobacteria bacterium]